MVDYIKPHIIGITESWANNDITDAELGLEGYAMFRKDRMGEGEEEYCYTSRTLYQEAYCNEAIWCKLGTGHTTVTIGVVYHCPNITKQINEKIHNAIREVNKGDCMYYNGDFNHENIKWDSLQNTGVEDQRFLCLVQDTFLNSTCIRTNQSSEGIRYSAVLTEKIRRQCRNTRTIGQQRSQPTAFLHKLKIRTKQKHNQCRRDFRKGNYKDIRKRLALIDWNDKMKKKTATECWNILRGELDSAMDSYVPMKKQGKRSKKKHLSKEAFRKI